MPHPLRNRSGIGVVPLANDSIKPRLGSILPIDERRGPEAQIPEARSHTLQVLPCTSRASDQDVGV